MMWNYGGGTYPMLSWMMPLMMIGMAALGIILIIAAWRLMRADEQIAESIKEISQTLKTK